MWPPWSPTTTAGAPSRVARLGEDKLMGRPSLTVCVHTRTKSSSWAAAVGIRETAPMAMTGTKATIARMVRDEALLVNSGTSRHLRHPEPSAANRVATLKAS